MRPDQPSHNALPGFQALTLNPSQCLRDLDALDALLAGTAELDERADILPFFRARPQLSLLLGSYNANMKRFDRLAYELPLIGFFRPDVAVGNWQRKRYCFVEFEEAKRDSIFRVTRRRTTEWAPRFQKGYCQVVDWFWLIESQQDTQQFEAQFGKRSIQAAGLLVIGRDQAISPTDWHRFEWWRDHVIVDSRGITCCTYDELARDLRDRLLIALGSGQASVARRRIAARRARRLPTDLPRLPLNHADSPRSSQWATHSPPRARVRWGCRPVSHTSPSRSSANRGAPVPPAPRR